MAGATQDHRRNGHWRNGRSSSTVLRRSGHRCAACSRPFVCRHHSHGLRDAPSPTVLEVNPERHVDSADRRTLVRSFRAIGRPAGTRGGNGLLATSGWRVLGSICKVVLPLYTRRATPVGYFEPAIRNPTMRLFFVERDLQRMYLLHQLSRVRCPTLVVAGEDHPVTPLARH